jgi:ABC-2 type transport system ATP-binding protein
VPPRLLAERIGRVVETVDLSPHRDLRLKTFSKGMLQRAGLAQAILHDPDLLELDEPCSGLDPIGRRLVRDVLVDLRARGKTIFFSSHILPDMEALCDRVSIIRDGIIAKTLGLDELMRLGEGRIEITARGVRMGTLAPLHEYVSAAADRGDETFIVVRERRFVRPVIEHLYGRGADVLAVAGVRRSLEDIFMQEIARPAVPGGAEASNADRPRDPAVFAGF